MHYGLYSILFYNRVSLSVWPLLTVGLSLVPHSFIIILGRTVSGLTTGTRLSGPVLYFFHLVCVGLFHWLA